MSRNTDWVTQALYAWGSYAGGHRVRIRGARLGYPGQSPGAHLAGTHYRSKEEQDAADRKAIAAKRPKVRTVAGRPEVVRHMVPQAQPKEKRSRAPVVEEPEWPENVKLVDRIVAGCAKELQDAARQKYALLADDETAAQRLNISRSTFQRRVLELQAEVRGYCRGRFEGAA